jgi:hypothetical protein
MEIRRSTITYIILDLWLGTCSIHFFTIVYLYCNVMNINDVEGGAYLIGDKYEFGWYDGHNFVKHNPGLVTLQHLVMPYSLSPSRTMNGMRWTGQ